MKSKVTAIFDLGKTNKKFFLFDEEMQEVHCEYKKFDEVVDDDGFPSDDLNSIKEWMRGTFAEALRNDNYPVVNLNFSAYGASLVHLDEEGNSLSPFYNYLKDIPVELIDGLYSRYGNLEKFCTETASPPLGMLNSGLQLYWIKNSKPELYQRIINSLHLPQYCSYLFSGKRVSEYTSVGCHTSLWNFENNDYHQWVDDEGFVEKFPEIVSTTTSYATGFDDHSINVGVGVHDSSAALIPYIQGDDDRFVLMSTGTWSICMNFFNGSTLTSDQFAKDSLNFLGIKGTRIKASRLFLGEEFIFQCTQLEESYGHPKGYYKSIKFEQKIYDQLRRAPKACYKFKYLQPEKFGLRSATDTNTSNFDTIEMAYHQLVIELVDIQVESLKLVFGNTEIDKVYVDGGFAANQVFIQILVDVLPSYKIYTTDFSLGTAFGAALLVNPRAPYTNFLESTYKVTEVKSHIMPVD